MSRIISALALLAYLWLASAALAQNTAPMLVNPPVCGGFVYAHITTATDTQLVAGVARKNVYVCDIEFSAAGAATFYLESSAQAACSSAATQIGILWTLAAGSIKPSANPIWAGVNAGAGNYLCVHSTGTGGFDVGVYYAQY